jgi:predicted RNase H-related nuclease YkuK (DUF458 family)
MKRKFDLEEVRKTIAEAGPSTKVYIGVDSERYKKNGRFVADFIQVVVVHIEGKHGAKIFAKVDTEDDYDQKLSRPFTRMMTETYKAAELYLAIEDVLIDKEFEIHLDINKDEQHGSSCAATSAIGYIKGVCGITPQLKPQAFAASYAADRAKELGLTSA